MNFLSLFPSQDPIRIGLIGTGAFGNSLLYQTRAIPRLHTAAVCDIDFDAARRACLRAGFADEALARCTLWLICARWPSS